MSKDSTYKKRLLKLAKTLEELPKKRFDFGTWVGEDWKGREDLSCGTTACALGWATTIPSLRKHGLRLIKHDFSNGGYVAMIGKDGKIRGDELEAGAELFGLSCSETNFLFYPDNELEMNGKDLKSPDEDASPKKVAKHIRNFVKVKYGK